MSAGICGLGSFALKYGLVAARYGMAAATGAASPLVVVAITAGAVWAASNYYFAPHPASIESSHPVSMESDTNLIQFFSKLTLINKPIFQGSSTQQARDIRNWMLTHREILNNVIAIDASHCNLTRIPSEISLFINLQTLILSNNQITTLAGVALPASLTYLGLSSNRITTLAGVALPASLTYLYLSSNRITTLAGVALPASLTYLDLSSNRITTLAGVALPASLVHLYLDSNLLSTLPDSFLDLSIHVHISANFNRFTARYCAELHRQLAQRRAIDGSHGPIVDMSIFDAPVVLRVGSLEDEIRSWSDEFAASFSQEAHPWSEHYESLLHLDDQPKQQLRDYLSRLRATADYQNPVARLNMVRRVGNMLQLACVNDAFKRAMIGCIEQGLASCGDRVLLTFNDIEVQWHLYQNLTDEQIVQLAIRAQRYALLNQHAETVAETRHLGDTIETILYYQVHLRDALQLPISTQGMLYPGCSGVDAVMLQRASSEIQHVSNIDLLAGSNYWQARMQQKYPQQAQTITEHYTEMLEVAAEWDRKDQSQKQEYLAAHPELLRIIQEYQVVDYHSATEAIQKQRRLEIARLDRALIA